MRLNSTSFPSIVLAAILKTEWYLNEEPSVNRHFPPVGWHNTVLQLPHNTTVCAWEKTVVMLKQPGHFTSWWVNSVLLGCVYHEVRVWALDKSFKFMFPCLRGRRRIEEILHKNLLSMLEAYLEYESRGTAYHDGWLMKRGWWKLSWLLSFETLKTAFSLDMLIDWPDQSIIPPRFTV